jgi:NAD(P)-dependent dehydrogenase (short-subunit alcohol dehydrogenase family)
MSTTTPLPLAGKSALVTGAARSIGAEIALTLGEAPRSSRTVGTGGSVAGWGLVAQGRVAAVVVVVVFPVGDDHVGLGQ